MSNETQLQKAIKIAVKDGWVETDLPHLYSKNGETARRYATAEFLSDLYTTDLNYLMPIAVKVLHTKELYNRAINNKTFFDTYWMLKNTYNTLVIDTNNKYTELFNACYEAVKLLEA